MSTPDAAKLCDIAVSVARETGEMLASRAGRVEVAATKSSPTDVVTEMDRRAEALIRSRILAERPDDAILGEEGGQTGDTAGAPAVSPVWPPSSPRMASSGRSARMRDLIRASARRSISVATAVGIDHVAA